MKKILPILFTILFVLGYCESSGQCHYQDTAIIHRTVTGKPYAIAISNIGKVAVSSVRTDTIGAKGVVKIWNDVYDFMNGLKPNDSVKLTSPQGLIYDNSENLYVVQTERSDSNIMIYNSSLTLIRVINNSAGATAWNNLRGIGIDSTQAIYVISGDSVGPGPAFSHIPRTGKLIRITDPLSTAIKTVLLSGLDSPKAVVVKGLRAFITEFGANKVNTYDLTSMQKIDSIAISRPSDITVNDCRLYITEHPDNLATIVNSFHLTDTAALWNITKPGTNGNFGIQLDVDKDLFVCDNDSNRVVFFRGVIPPSTGGPLIGGLNGLTFCVGSSIQYDLDHGTAGYWTSADPSIVLMDTGGLAHAQTAGFTIVYQTIGTAIYSYYAQVDAPLTPAGPIYSNSDIGRMYGQDTMCYLNALRLNDDSYGDYWISSDNTIAEVSRFSGVVWPKVPGMVSIIHSRSNTCGNVSASFSLTIVGPPDIADITGPLRVCSGQEFTLSDAIAGGTWSSSDSIATIDNAGNVNTNRAGQVTITYVTANRCDSKSATISIQIDSLQTAGTIEGIDSVCRTLSISLIDTGGTSGGEWSSSNTSIAIVDTTGTVFGLDTGSVTITYTVINSCDTLIATKDVRVIPTPEAGSITGADSVCVNDVINLIIAGASETGTWSSSDPTIAIVDASGTVTGIQAGGVTISYVVTGTCFNDTATFLLGVIPLAHSGDIAGLDRVCPGHAVSLTHDTSTGAGVWIAEDVTTAVINSNGEVSGVAPGSTVIYYIATNACNIDTATYAFTVDSLPHAGSITGVDSVCVNETINLMNSTASAIGIWSCSNPSLAVIDAVGAVTGLDAGTVTISYIVTGTCVNDTTTFDITIRAQPLAGAIIGADEVCEGFTVLLGHAASEGEGTWITDDPTIAAIDAVGMVTGNITGSTVIRYISANLCGADTAVLVFTVNPAPHAGTISGPSNGCIGNNYPFSLTGESGTSTWISSDPSVAAVDASGMLYTGLDGNVTITHISSTTCGSDSSSVTFTVDPYAYSGPIDGIYGPVCMGNGPDWLYANYAVGSGYWYSDDPSIADVDGSGMVTYYSAGVVNIHYVTGTNCSTDDNYLTLTINPLPVAGSISGADSVCSGSSITLISFGAGSTGTWVSSNPAAATVSPTGVVTGLSPIPVTVTIKYIVTEYCGQDSSTHSVYIKPLPLSSSFSGPTAVCYGSTISLSATNAGGIWSISNSTIATVSTSGIVSGAAAAGGTATITYTMSGCGSVYSTAPIYVTPLPAPGNITGLSSICLNGFDTLRDHSATPAGTWTSRQGYVLFLSSVSGTDTVMLKGTAAAIDTIIYTVNNSCGTDSALFEITINPLPVAGYIFGDGAVCAGSTGYLWETGGIPSGIWSSSDPTLASVDALTGDVTGIAAGAVVITYSGYDLCGTTTEIWPMTIDSLPNAVITPGPTSICLGTTMSLSATGSYGTGTWSSSDTYIAPVYAGSVFGDNPGTVTISYITSTPSCGEDTAVILLTIDSPDAGVISGADTVCAGASITLINVAPGGVWSSTDIYAATVSATGVVTGVNAGYLWIEYTVTSPTCGFATVSYPITVQPLPLAGTISGVGNVCAGATTILASTVPGTWSCVSLYATVDSLTGLVTGLTTGTATITSTVTDMCGSDYATFSMVVTDVPVMTPISCIDSICQGNTFIATAAPASGTWSTYYGYLSSTPVTATTASVFAASGGIDTLTYTATNSCGNASVSKAIGVLIVPDAGYITGPDSLCPGATAVMYDLTGEPGGLWSNTGTNISITAAGNVIALSPGTDTVQYAVAGYCGATVATHSLIVNALPVAGTITGPATVCIGSSITLANATGTPGGTWTCGTGGNITAGGVFTGITAGAVSISYEAITPCGSLYASYSVTVDPLPTVAIITGTTVACSGGSATLNNATTTGIWSCSPASVATIDASTGQYHGVAPGTAMVSYAVTNGCGTTTVTQPITINTLPVVAAILGTAAVCPPGTTFLTDATPGGLWSASNGHATISSSGLVTGVSTGLDTIYYAVNNTCGTSIQVRTVTVNSMPVADTIAGPSMACTGTPVTLTSTVPGGTWSVSNGHATVAGGIVTGITTGADTVYYVVSNSCGSVTASRIVTIYVSVIPMVTVAVSPYDTLCGATPATYTATPVNGGIAPFIQWRRNGMNIGTGLTFGDSPADGDVISCRMASNATCPTIDTVYSNNITMHVFPNVIPVVTVTVSPSDTIAYIGQPVTFTATLTNCGSSPVYQWYENGTAIAGATSATYSTTAVGNDAFYCIADCNIPCAVAVSNQSNVVTLYTGHVGINALNQSGMSFSLYPNPNNGNFTLIGKTEGINEPVTYEVIDMMGRILHSGITLPNQNIIHEEVVTDNHIAPGQYVLRVITSSGAEQIHFTINK